jgi:hypothetical protein
MFAEARKRRIDRRPDLAHALAWRIIAELIRRHHAQLNLRSSTTSRVRTRGESCSSRRATATRATRSSRTRTTALEGVVRAGKRSGE